MSETIMVFEANTLKRELGIDDKHTVFYSRLYGDESLPPYTVVERDKVEHDDNFIQPIGCAVLYRLTDQGVELLVNKRSPTSREERLHDKVMITFGGHVDLEKNDGINPRIHIVNTIIRELKEELGLTEEDYDKDDIFNTVVRGELDYIYSTADDVSRHHIGFITFVKIDKDISDMTLEDNLGVIEYINIKDLIKMIYKREITTDHWSDVIINKL